MNTNLYLYMAGDNNLDISARNDIENELLRAKPSNRTTIFVQFDRRPPLPWETDRDKFKTQRFKVVEGKRELICKLEETNSGDPMVLHSFLKDCQSLVKADRQMAIIWGHGGGHKNKSDFKDEGYRWVGIDDSSKDALGINELATSLNDLHSKLDIVAFDACLMSVMEVAYSLKDKARYMIASQAIEPANGWPYQKLIGQFEQPDFLLNSDFIKETTFNYKDSYSSTNKEVTLSGICLSKVETIAACIDELAKALLNEMDKLYESYANIITVVQRFEDHAYADLKHLAILLRKLNSIEIRQKAEYLIELFDSMVISNDVKGNKYSNANGISILLPMHLEHDLPYDLQMYRDYPHWLTFIQMLLSKKVIGLV